MLSLLLFLNSAVFHAKDLLRAGIVFNIASSQNYVYKGSIAMWKMLIITLKIKFKTENKIIYT